VVITRKEVDTARAQAECRSRPTPQTVIGRPKWRPHRASGLTLCFSIPFHASNWTVACMRLALMRNRPQTLKIVWPLGSFTI
jgi:hypothetical protein